MTAKRANGEAKNGLQVSQVSHTFSRGVAKRESGSKYRLIKHIHSLLTHIYHLYPYTLAPNFFGLFVRARGSAKRELLNQPIMKGTNMHLADQFCFNCVFFVPNGMKHNELDQNNWDEGIPGDCRRKCPFPGELRSDNGEAGYAYWPVVISSDWCGEHKGVERQTTQPQADTESQPATY